MDLSAVRLRYAQRICEIAGVAHPGVCGAFAGVAREAFLGRGPWTVYGPGPHDETSTDDPRDVYQDVLVALAPDRRINNGQPSLHALCLAAVDPRPGERVAHVGAGTGYYTALLAELVAPSGCVDAFEIEPDLAALADRHLAPWRHARVHAASGCRPLGAAGVIYVSASVSELSPRWLDALVPGGRLLCPLAAPGDLGGMLLVTRLGPAVFAASLLCRASFIPCAGGQTSSPAASASLVEAFARRDPGAVRSLVLRPPPHDSIWHAGDGWWLSTAAPDDLTRLY